MSNLYVQFSDGSVETLIVGGSPMAIVNMARDCVGQHAGDDVAARLFGLKRFTARGSVTASTRERGMSAGLRHGEGFAVIASGITVSGAASMEQAIDLIDQARAMLNVATDLV
jgi:hypothetical protein